MNINPPICFKYYKDQYEIVEIEISKLNRLKKISQLIGLTIILFSLISFFIPNLLKLNMTIENLSKLSTILFGGAFFGTINFFNKGDLMALKKRKIDLEVCLSDYDEYHQKTELEKQQLEEECNKIIQKVKGL
jgi:hypothetical protein